MIGLTTWYRWSWKLLCRPIWNTCRPAWAVKIRERKRTFSINWEWPWKRSFPMRKRWQSWIQINEFYLFKKLKICFCFYKETIPDRRERLRNRPVRNQRHPTDQPHWPQPSKSMKILIRDSWVIIFEVLPCRNVGWYPIQTRTIRRLSGKHFGCPERHFCLWSLITTSFAAPVWQNWIRNKDRTRSTSLSMSNAIR